MSDGGRCVKHENWHAHCQQCCREEVAALRAQVATLTAERDEARNLLREAERVDEIIGERDVAHGVAEKAIEELAARDAEVPGLSTTPGYTMDDVDRIEAARGKPYAKLRETVESGVAARKAMRNLLSTIVDESDGYWIADGFHEAVEAAVKIVPPEFMTALECDHCGDVAHESITGMFGDGDGVACMSCGWPGNVSADEESVHWSMDDDGKCARSDCDECAATGNETKEVAVQRDAHWHCEFCGAVEPAQEGYEIGDSEPCTECTNGVARVMTLEDGARLESEIARGIRTPKPAYSDNNETKEVES